MSDAKVLHLFVNCLKTKTGRSYQTAIIRVEVAYSGACEEPCDGMGSMGHFQSFFSRATNTGLELLKQAWINIIFLRFLCP